MNSLPYFGRHILQSSIFIILCIIFSLVFSMPAFMAGKVYGIVGEKVSVTLSDLPSGADVEWVLSQNGTIIETKTGKSFTKSFTTAGEYILRANAQGDDNFQSSSTIDISIAANLPNFSPLQAVLKTIPESNNGKLELPGQSASVTFSFADSTGSIDAYEIETDTFSDGDADGVIDNDIDNKNDISYKSGSYFQKTYTNDGIPKKAVLTVKGKNGEISSQSVLIVFSQAATLSAQSQKQKEILPRLESIPQSNAQGNIAISPRTNTILLYSSTSEGNITEYRIDTDTTIDSDGDGDATNDVNNVGTDSLTQGSVFPISINAESLPKTIALTVVDSNGKKKTVQKNIIIDASISSGPQSNSEFLTPILFASRSKISMGDSVVFKLFNIAPDATVSWDFNGDGKWDIEKSTETEVEYKYAEEGNYNIRTEIIQVGSAPIISKAQVSVATSTASRTKTLPPKAHFLAQKQGNKVSFLSSESSADENLLDPNLSYSWDFGDGYKAEGPNPIHIYEKPGLYTISLTVEDSIERSAVFVDSVEILELSTAFDTNQHGGKSWLSEVLPASTPLPVVDAQTIPNTTENTDSKNTGTFTIPWIFWVLLVILMLPFLLVIKQKIDHPDLSFDAILKNMVQGWSVKKEKRIVENDGSAQLLPAVDSTPSTTTNASASTPEWMRTYDQNNQNTKESLSSSQNTVDSPMLDDEVEETRQTMENVIPEHIDIPSAENNSALEPGNQLDAQPGALPDWLQGTPTDQNNQSTPVSVESNNTDQPAESIEPIDNNNTLPDWLSGNNSDQLPAAEVSSSGSVNNLAVENDDSDDIFTSIIEDTPLDSIEEDPFATNHPEWLTEILETPYFYKPYTEPGEELSPKNTWDENDKDTVLGLSDTTNNISEILPDADTDWEDDGMDEEYNNFDDDEDWWTEDDSNEDDTNDVKTSIDSEVIENNSALPVSENETISIVNTEEQNDKSFSETLQPEEENNELSNSSQSSELDIPIENIDQKIDTMDNNSTSEEITEEIIVAAKDAQIPVKEDSSKVPQWIQSV